MTEMTHTQKEKLGIYQEEANHLVTVPPLASASVTVEELSPVTTARKAELPPDTHT